jgi:hypothetical protein
MPKVQLDFDGGAPPSQAWRRRLNSHANKLKEFSVTFMEAIKMVHAGYICIFCSCNHTKLQYICLYCIIPILDIIRHYCISRFTALEDPLMRQTVQVASSEQLSKEIY